MRRLKILTWHVHGSYLYYLTQVPHDFYLLSKPDRGDGYLGKFGHFPWGTNVHDMPVSDVKNQSFDGILFQRRDHYLRDQFDILSPEQRKLPRIYLEHDTPWMDPTEQRHWVTDPKVLLVHVTAFNALMWNSADQPTRVIEHGVIPPTVAYTGEYAKGLTVINHLGQRGRRLGLDIFNCVRAEVPIDLTGMAAEEIGGIGEVQHNRLPAFEARYRFLFNPIRYTSLGLAVIEAMMVGLPVVGLATTEMATAVPNGVAGYVDTNVNRLIAHMKRLINDPEEARTLGAGARRYALSRFHIDRFVRDWCETLASVCGVESRPTFETAGRRP